MGDNLPILWFGKKSSELKEILETDKTLTENEKRKLKQLIKDKETEERK